MMTILVTGSTGRIGRRVLESLSETGRSLRAAKRRPMHPGDIAFDWCDSQTWQAALEGVQDVFLMTPEALGNLCDPAIEFLGMAREAGVNRLVLMSALGAEVDDHGTGMGDIEAAVISEFHQHCILRPNTFMQNFSEGPFLGSILERNAIVAPVGNARVSFIDLRDIADCVVSAILDPAINGPFILTGPDALSFSEAARHISDAIDREVHHLSPSDEEMDELLRSTGMPPPLASMVLGFYTSLRGTAHGEITSAVKELTQRSPRTFSSFSQQSAHVWRQHV